MHTTKLPLKVSDISDNKTHNALWLQEPKVDMGSKVRREIEALLRQHAIWNPYNVQVPS